MRQDTSFTDQNSWLELQRKEASNRCVLDYAGRLTHHMQGLLCCAASGKYLCMERQKAARGSHVWEQHIVMALAHILPESLQSGLEVYINTFGLCRVHRRDNQDMEHRHDQHSET